MKKLLFESDNIIEDVIDARNRREDFFVTVEGNLALKLSRFAPYYERYRDAYRKNTPGKTWKMLSFAWRGLQTPLFWGICILADFEARRTKFVYVNGILRAEFYFNLNSSVDCAENNECTEKQ
jgi:hypothetical protein